MALAKNQIIIINNPSQRMLLPQLEPNQPNPNILASGKEFARKLSWKHLLLYFLLGNP
jgi:hypothetical protein